MAFTTETLPSEFIYRVTSGSESVFPLPTLDTTPSLFGGSDVVLVVEKNGSTLSLTSGYTLGPTGYLTTVAALVPGDTLRVARQTNRTAPLVTASLRSFSAEMFNKGFWQLMYLVQELLSAIQKCLGYVVDATGALVWDFENKRGVSCASPVGSLDVTNKTYVDAADQAAITTANAYALNLLLNTTAAVTGASMVQNSQAVTPGQTLITFPVAFSVGIIDFDGAVQTPGVDYTHTPGTSSITLPAPGIPYGVTKVNAFLF